jgi:hypothetical protein
MRQPPTDAGARRESTIRGGLRVRGPCSARCGVGRPGLAGSNESAFVGEHDGLDAVAEVELGEDPLTCVFTVAWLTMRCRAISVLESP